MSKGTIGWRLVIVLCCLLVPVMGGTQEAGQIRQAQARLQAAGFDPGPVDGRLGPQTILALRQYQATHGLRVTGALDAATRHSLALAQTQPPGSVPASPGSPPLPETATLLPPPAVTPPVPLPSPDRRSPPAASANPREGEAGESSPEALPPGARLSQQLSAGWQALLAAFRTSQERVSEWWTQESTKMLDGFALFSQQLSAGWQPVRSAFSKEHRDETIEKITTIVMPMFFLLIEGSTIFLFCRFVKLLDRKSRRYRIYRRYGKFIPITIGLVMLYFVSSEWVHLLQYSEYTHYTEKSINTIILHFTTAYKYTDIFPPKELYVLGGFIAIVGNAIGGVYLLASCIDFQRKNIFIKRAFGRFSNDIAKNFNHFFFGAFIFGYVISISPHILIKRDMDGSTEMPRFISWYIDLWWPSTIEGLLGLPFAALGLMLLSVLLIVVGARWLSCIPGELLRGPGHFPGLEWVALGPFVAGVVSLAMSIAGLLRGFYFLVYFILAAGFRG